MSGGYCQRPECHAHLFPDDVERDITVAEIAHVIAATDSGPRADKDLPNPDRAAFENLILLCPTCHTIIDKAPDEFSVDQIRTWKQNHEERLKHTFSIAVCEDRPTARALMEPLLEANFAIFEEYGPDNDYRHNPEAEMAKLWQRKMKTQIIPNTKLAVLILDTNRALLTEEERGHLEQYRQHLDDLITKHLMEEDQVARRFPIEISEVLL